MINIKLLIGTVRGISVTDGNGITTAIDPTPITHLMVALENMNDSTDVKILRKEFSLREEAIDKIEELINLLTEQMQ